MAAHKRGECGSCGKDQYRCDGCEEIGCRTDDCTRKLFDYTGGFFDSIKCLGCRRDFK